MGDSSLDLELRALIGEFTDRLRVRRELNPAIELKFRKAGIEIPFSQRDLHFRNLPGAPQAQASEKEDGPDANIPFSG